MEKMTEEKSLNLWFLAIGIIVITSFGIAYNTSVKQEANTQKINKEIQAEKRRADSLILQIQLKNK
jgi:hypothetical protein